jgi:hypothetical protein
LATTGQSHIRILEVYIITVGILLRILYSDFLICQELFLCFIKLAFFVLKYLTKFLECAIVYLFTRGTLVAWTQLHKPCR